jgi:hypothetical protein
VGHMDHSESAAYSQDYVSWLKELKGFVDA